MSRMPLLLAAAAVSACLLPSRAAHAIAGDLHKPSIAIPTVGDTGKHDPVVQRMHDVLTAHTKQFAGGHFLNAHSVLHFSGGTQTINALLDELSRIEGATINVHFSKEPGLSPTLFSTSKAPAPAPAEPYDCTIDHNGWGDARSISLTIHLASDRVDLSTLALPPIRGK